MYYEEKDLERLIMNTDSDILCDRGLFIHNKKINQINLGEFGRLDILSYSKNYDPFTGIPFLSLRIFELKKYGIGKDALFQAIRYAKGVKFHLEKRGFTNNYNISIILVGSGDYQFDNEVIDLANLIETKDEYCDNGFIGLSIVEYTLDVNGLHFNYIV